MKFHVEVCFQVTFNPNVEVLTMYTWSYAYWAARKGKWDQIARDHARFERRIQEIGREISHVLKDDHRQSVLKKLKM